MAGNEVNALPGFPLFGLVDLRTANASGVLFVQPPMLIPHGVGVFPLPNRPRNMPWLPEARWSRFQMGRRGLVWLQLNDFRRKIIEGFKNCFAFHKW